MRRCFLFHPRMHTWNLSLLVLGLSLPCLLSVSLAQAPPITPSGLDTQVSEPIAVGGQTQYNITGGTRPGGGTNLFHSFGDFGVPANHIANFLNETRLPTSNILGRVTGGDISTIFGTIQTTDFGSANLFLMNPNGFLFGPNATVNVGGMVAFTSADYLRLAELDASNTGIFRADPTHASVLTNAPVAAFGFLGSNPGAITVRGSQFSVTDGQSISLVGGDTSIESGTPEGGTTQTARLSAPNGNILLASATSPGEFDASTLQPLPNVSDTSFSSFGSISLAPGSSVDVSGTNTVSIKGGQFVLSVNDAVMTTSESAPIEETVSLSPGSELRSVNAGSDSDAANVEVLARKIIIDGATIETDAQGPGAGGNILVNAAAIDLINFATIKTVSSLDSSGSNAGNVTLKATQQITAVDSFLNTDTVGGAGLGGNIILRAPMIGMDGGVLSASTSGAGNAGNILLEGQQITLGASPLASAQGVDLFTGTSGSGHGGTVTLRGLDGPSSHADSVTISGTSRLHTLTGSDGSAGDIIINAVRFTLTDHANLNADTFGSKGAGTITITATDHVTVSGLSTRVSSSSDNGATGDAGKITVSAPTVMIENGGSISTSTTGEGAGGNINILAGQSVTITNDSRLSASSTGPGNAGNILINAGGAFVVTNSKSAVTTQADTASGGNITVLATDRVHLTNSHISASVADGSGGGGNISIDPQSVILQNSQILAQAAQGQGGAITITTNLFLPDANSSVNADSGSGLNGTVTIQSPNAPASGKIQPLGNTPLQATSLLNQHCAALAGGEFSSFTVAGRDSLPTEPGSWLASPLALRPAELSTASVTESGKQARGVIDLAQDTTVLSLRQIAPPGFLTQAFPMDWLAGCTS